MECIANLKSFGGQQQRYTHWSESNQCTMTFSIYLPENTDANNPKPVLYWLSGLTCNDENFVQKAGAQQYASQHNIIIVCPDTSPRGDGVADDEQGAWDFGLGAGFYVDATQSPWSQHYKMYSYVTQELPELIEKHFAATSQRAISGHSMGGHGALTIALRNPERYSSVSAFAPICSPIECDWGQKALGLYIGDNQQTWHPYDTCSLIKNASTNPFTSKLPILVDQGDADNFLDEQLRTPLLETALSNSAINDATIRMQPGYDHSYFFIASFIEEHIAFHASKFKR